MLVSWSRTSNLMIRPPSLASPKCWDYRREPPHPAKLSVLLRSRLQEKVPKRQTGMDLLNFRHNLKACRHPRVPRNNELQKDRLNGKEEEVSEQYPNQTQHRKPVVASIIPVYRPYFPSFTKVSNSEKWPPASNFLPQQTTNASRKKIRWQREKQQALVDRSRDAFSVGWKEASQGLYKE
ncbi:hypothetical protein AAY473_033191 [Plecturocebus cupreus]